jgi:hypothetical protein
MNKLEIFQAVYGKDYAFTETELSRLLKVTELIVRECAGLCSIAAPGRDAEDIEEAIMKHFGVGS